MSQNQPANFLILVSCHGILEPLILCHSHVDIVPKRSSVIRHVVFLPQVLNSHCQLQWLIIQVLPVAHRPLSAEVLKIPGEHRSLEESLINGEEGRFPPLSFCMCMCVDDIKYHEAESLNVKLGLIFDVHSVHIY